MLEKTFTTLSATPPPRAKNHFYNAGKANAYMFELEVQLGLEKSKPIFNIGLVNKRIADLESMLSEKNLKDAAAVAVAATPPPPPPPPPAPATSTRKLEICAGEFFAGDLHKLKELPESEKRNSIAVLFWKNRLTYPGCELDFARIDTTKNQRNISDAHFAGMNRISVSIHQELITAKLKTK